MQIHISIISVGSLAIGIFLSSIGFAATNSWNDIEGNYVLTEYNGKSTSLNSQRQACASVNIKYWDTNNSIISDSKNQRLPGITVQISNLSYDLSLKGCVASQNSEGQFFILPDNFGDYSYIYNSRSFLSDQTVYELNLPPGPGTPWATVQALSITKRANGKFEISGHIKRAESSDYVFVHGVFKR